MRAKLVFLVISMIAQTGFSDTLVTSSEGVLKLLPKGEYFFGRVKGDDGRILVPGKKIKVPEGVFLGVSEVSQGQWEKVYNLSFEIWREKSGLPRLKNYGDNLPIHGISYYDAISFCNRLTSLDRERGWLAEGERYTLPCEVVWEYACKAGTESDFFTGTKIDDTSAILGFEGANFKGPAAVEALKPNPWGFYGMAGNVSEWCADIFREGIPNNSAVPIGLSDGDILSEVRVVVKGGNWHSDPSAGRSVSRSASIPHYRSVIHGFRLMLIKSGLAKD